MNIDQLMDSLSGNDPNPGSVLGLVASKRRAARRRMYTATGGVAAVAVAIVAGVLLQGVNLGGSASSSSGVMAGSAPSAAGGGSSPLEPAAAAPNPNMHTGSFAGGVNASCAAVPLKEDLASAVQQHGSVIVGYATASDVSTSSGGLSYYQVTLRSVRTLAGPGIRSGRTAWVLSSAATSSAGSSVTPEGQSLWAPGGEFFGTAAPAAKGTPTGLVLRPAPVVSGQVIFSADGCVSTSGLPTHPYLGPVSQQPPGSGAVNGFAGSATPLPGTRPRLNAVPLADVEKLVPKG